MTSRADEIRRELRAELRDDYKGTAPTYEIMWAEAPVGLWDEAVDEALVGYVFWDGESEHWRCGQERRGATELRVSSVEEAVGAGMDRLAVELAEAAR